MSLGQRPTQDLSPGHGDRGWSLWWRPSSTAVVTGAAGLSPAAEPRGSRRPPASRAPTPRVTTPSGLRACSSTSASPGSSWLSSVGAALSTAGASFQGTFRNPLAEPYLLGVSAGAALGATIAIVSKPLDVAGHLHPAPARLRRGHLRRLLGLPPGDLRRPHAGARRCSCREWRWAPRSPPSCRSSW